MKVLDFGLAKPLEVAAFRRAARSCRRSPRPSDDAGWRHPRYRRLHGAGAGEGETGRQAERRLGVRVRVLRDADRGGGSTGGRGWGARGGVVCGAGEGGAPAGRVPLPKRTGRAGGERKGRRPRVACSAAPFFVYRRAPRGLRPARGQRVARVPLWRRAAVAATVIFVALAAGYAGWRLRPAPSRPVMRLAITMPEHEVFTPGPSAPLAISRRHADGLHGERAALFACLRSARRDPRRRRGKSRVRKRESPVLFA